MRSWTINSTLRSTLLREEAFNMLIRDRKIFPPSFICMEYCTWSWLLTQNMIRGRNLIVRQTKKLYSSPLYGVPLCQLELMPRKGKIHFFGKGTDMAVQELQLRTTRRDTTHEKTTMHDIYKQLRKTTMYARSCFYASKLHTWSWLNWSEISRIMLVQTKFDLFSTKWVFMDSSTLFGFSLSFKTI